jgi:hypothetical protein
MPIRVPSTIKRNRKTGSDRDFFSRADFSSPRPRLSVRLESNAKTRAAEGDTKPLIAGSLLTRGTDCYMAPRGGRFAALRDHRTPMRSPNDVAARTTEMPRRFAEYDRMKPESLTPPAAGGVYDEDVFQYFLDIERRRSLASGQTFLLLVINSIGEPGDVFPSAVAEEVFAALLATVRDTDFVGWHSQRTAIGAVLIQTGDSSKLDAVGRVSSRLSKALVSHLPASLVERLRFRLCQVRAGAEVWS